MPPAPMKQPGAERNQVEQLVVRLGQLSERERQIMVWVAMGKTNPEIGCILHISEFTVKNHMKSIFSKLDVTNRAQAVAYLAQVRERSLDVLAERGTGSGELVELVLRHEHQHDETMLQAIELARLLPAPLLPRDPRPAAPGGIPVGSHHSTPQIWPWNGATPRRRWRGCETDY